MERALESIQNALAALRVTSERVRQTTDDGFLVCEVGGEPLAVHVAVTALKRDHPGFGPIPAHILEICRQRGLHPWQVRVNLSYHKGCTDYCFHGADDLIRTIRNDRNRWRRPN